MCLFFLPSFSVKFPSKICEEKKKRGETREKRHHRARRLPSSHLKSKMPAHTSALKRKHEVREAIYRKSAQVAEYRVDGVCMKCRRTLGESEIKRLATRQDESSPTHFVPCKDCDGSVDVNFVVRADSLEGEGSVFHVFEYYSKEQLLGALSSMREEMGFPHLDTLLSYAPELLWSMTYHFGSYEEGMKELEN